MSFSEEKLTGLITQLADCRKIWVALSGGLDSVVLLQALHRLQLKQKDCFPVLSAIHVNHQLQQEAGQWQAFCADLCRQLAVPLQIATAQIDTASGASLEDLARQARYAIFTEMLEADHCLLMAHHVDDQMETMLLRLLRGAGMKGLRGMPRSRRLGEGRLYRPLLDFSRRELVQYAQTNALQWMEDHSNQDRLIDRNYCRHEILPLIEARWPAYRDSWSRTATLATEAESLLSQYAQQDLKGLATEQDTVLDISQLMGFTGARARNVLKYWLQQNGIAPGWHTLHRLSDEILKARVGSAMLKGGTWEIHRYRNWLHLLQQVPALDQTAAQLAWDPQRQQQLQLPQNGILQGSFQTGRGLRLPLPGSLCVLTRKGGETLRLPGRPEKSLKKILQENRVLPWLRQRLPLLYVDGQLAYVPGIGVCEEFLAGAAEQGLTVKWQAPSFAYQELK